MLRVTCPHCGSKLNAKDELAGQTRKCPKCAQPVQIVADPTADEAIVADAGDVLPTVRLLDRLHRQCQYLVCGKSGMVAMWENNGRGWMLKTNAGMVNAKRNCEQLPHEGDFKLIELKFTITPEGKRLVGLTTYQLANRWALTVLDEGDDPIVEKVTGYGSLNRDQKNVVRQALRDHFMRPVWQEAAEVLEFLGNMDYHSHSVGANAG
jgi:hypothetical protein